LYARRKEFSMRKFTDTELKEHAKAIAAELAKEGEADSRLGESGVLKRGIAPPLRVRFIELRTNLIARGISDPLLARFDSYSVPQAATRAVAEQLGKVAEEL
jgi:hypothetical protein